MPKWLKAKDQVYQNALKESLKEDIHLVPVPLKIDPKNPGWRLDFKAAELQLITGQGSIKKVLRLLKYFRNVNGEIFNVKSYFFKTIIMHMIRDDPFIDWSEGNLAKNFLEVLRRLQKAYKQKTLSSFFIPEKNIFENVKHGTFSSTSSGS